MEKAQELLKQKAALESEIRQLESDLRTHGVDRTTQLVDSAGFPRSDIDIVAIREIRQSLICKQNDLKALMKQIEDQLVTLHQVSSPPEPVETKRRPFARVSIVTPNSPASEAGLLVGDKIIQYGSVDATNHDNFKAMSTETIDNINKPLKVAIERVVGGKPEVLNLTLHLRHGWGGESLLGCHILPL
ncbi:putative 26S proteasome regulatory subunit [Coemansia erecta]|nr:putative 26S proteasome regulatory subunit [Coemansia sp. RSA 2618]KAJ2829669.1 putative 26S proteasome regulatory subunit [Coemansia erecta]